MGVNLRWALGVVCATAMCAAVLCAGTAYADKLTELPEPVARVSLKDRVTKNLTLMSNEMGLHMKTLTGEMVDMTFDVKARKARLKLNAGSESLSLNLDSKLVMRGKIARVSTTIDLNILGENLTLDLPDFELVPQSWQGQRWVEFRVPIIEGRF